jgi:hypothetical protein
VSPAADRRKKRTHPGDERRSEESLKLYLDGAPAATADEREKSHEDVATRLVKTRQE